MYPLRLRIALALNMLVHELHPVALALDHREGPDLLVKSLFAPRVQVHDLTGQHGPGGVAYAAAPAVSRRASISASRQQAGCSSSQAEVHTRRPPHTCLQSLAPPRANLCAFHILPGTLCKVFPHGGGSVTDCQLSSSCWTGTHHATSEAMPTVVSKHYTLAALMTEGIDLAGFVDFDGIWRGQAHLDSSVCNRQCRLGCRVS